MPPAFLAFGQVALVVESLRFLRISVAGGGDRC